MVLSKCLSCLYFPFLCLAPSIRKRRRELARARWKGGEVKGGGGAGGGGASNGDGVKSSIYLSMVH